MQINQISNAPMQKNQAPQQNFKGSAAFRLPMNKLKLGPEIVGEAKALARSTVASGERLTIFTDGDLYGFQYPHVLDGPMEELLTGKYIDLVYSRTQPLANALEAVSRRSIGMFKQLLAGDNNKNVQKIPLKTN